MLCRDWSCLSHMARTATGTQTFPFTVRAVQLHFCISPGADVSKRIPSFGSGAGLDPILLQLLWLPRETEAILGFVYPTLRMGYIAGPHAKPVSKVRQLLPM